MDTCEETLGLESYVEGGQEWSGARAKSFDERGQGFFRKLYRTRSRQRVPRLVADHVASRVFRCDLARGK